MAAAARTLARFFARTGLQEMPQRVRDHGALLLLNVVGVMVSNGRNPRVLQAREAARSLSGDVGERPGAPMESLHAALVDGIASHISDFDDTHPEGGLHPSGVLAPALLAVARMRPLTGGELLRAFIAGQEIMARIAAAAPHRFTLRGLHASSICGVVAAAAAAAIAEGSDEEIVSEAMGIASSQAGGVIQTVLEGGDLKSFHLGWAAMSSVWAARLAAAGIQGPRRALEGEQGLLGAFLGERFYREADLGRLTAGLGETWETPEVIAKPYPCCHFTHAAIDAARAFVAGGGDARRIESIVLRVPREAVSVVCEPWQERVRADSVYSAKFSLPVICAVALRNGAVTDRLISEALGDPEVAGLVAATRYEVDPDPNLARTYGSELRLTLGPDAEEWRSRVVFPTGSRENPVGADLVVDKFMSLVSPVLGEERAAELSDFLMSIDAQEDLGPLIAVLG